jgi:hypothetical protein
MSDDLGPYLSYRESHALIELRQLKQQVEYLKDTATRQDATLSSILFEVRAMGARLDQLDRRLRRLEEPNKRPGQGADGYKEGNENGGGSV